MSDFQEGYSEERPVGKRQRTTYCADCEEPIKSGALICPHCGERQRRLDWDEELDREEVRQFASKKVLAGVFGILFGEFGVHKFILGQTGAGLVMLLVSVLTCGLGMLPMGIIGLIEGIIYLTKTDEEFYQLYSVEKKGWF